MRLFQDAVRTAGGRQGLASRLHVERKSLDSLWAAYLQGRSMNPFVRAALRQVVEGETALDAMAGEFRALARLIASHPAMASVLLALAESDEERRVIAEALALVEPAP